MWGRPGAPLQRPLGEQTVGLRPEITAAKELESRVAFAPRANALDHALKRPMGTKPLWTRRDVIDGRVQHREAPAIPLPAKCSAGKGSGPATSNRLGALDLCCKQGALAFSIFLREAGHWKADWKRSPGQKNLMGVREIVSPAVVEETRCLKLLGI